MSALFRFFSKNSLNEKRKLLTLLLHHVICYKATCIDNDCFITGPRYIGIACLYTRFGRMHYRSAYIPTGSFSVVIDHATISWFILSPTVTVVTPRYLVLACCSSSPVHSFTSLFSLLSIARFAVFDQAVMSVTLCLGSLRYETG